jgi:hypothetical protein
MVSSSSIPLASESHRFMKEGQGWRVGWREAEAAYQGLLGGEDWALELTADEFYDFCRLAQQLASTMAAMAAELMEEERIVCEAESDVVWLEVEGVPHSYSLRFILTRGRQCEGAWPESAVGELLTALTGLMLF